MKKIICLFLSLLLILSIVPISVFASERTVITEINAYFNFTMPSYGDAVDRTPFEITVEGDIPVTVSTDNFDWYIEKNEELISIKNGYFTDGLWCFDVYVELNDIDNYTFDYENGTTLKINDVVWCTDIESDGWVYSPSVQIEHIPGKLPLDIYSTKYSNVPVSYVGTPIEPYDFSIEVIGGTKPYTFSKSGGSDWLQISQDGILSGTPVSPGTNDPIYVTVTDALGAEASLEVSVKKTHIASSEREKISKIEATIDLPEFYCGYNIENSYPVTVTEGSPAVIATNNSDFYYVDIEGNIGDSTKQLVVGKFTMDFKVEISGEDGYNYILDEENLEIIINGQPAGYENISVYKDSSFVWVTIPPFEVDHIFDNDTDATCNGCDFTREGCDHQYDNACDNSCNVCSATRSTKHQYDAVCDDECNECKEKRIATPHTFDNCNDGYCNVCNFYRSTPSHSYDDCNDVDCNLCGTTRSVPVHSYTNFMDNSCNFCGETRTINTIALNENATAIVEVGGTIIEYIFTPSFTGEFAFEAFASSDTRGYIFDENEVLIWEDDDSGIYHQFKIQQTFEAGKTYLLKLKFYSEDVTGEIPFSIVCVHDFDDDCDDFCGICELVREAPHSYDNAADKQCNECGNIRELNFIGLNETKVVEITINIEYVDFVFIPVISGKYSFIGLGDENQDTFAKLLDSEGNMITSNDDSGGSRQFKITYDMEAGKTYILRACFYNNNNIGAFPVTFICEHSYDDEFDVDCNACGYHREAEKNVNVVAKGNIDYTVLGNIVIVENNLACKVGYVSDGKYVNVSGTKNPDSTYSYTVPDGVTEVVLLTKGDVDSNNEIDATDYLRIKGHFLGSYNFDAVNFFAGDVTNEGEIDATDYLRIKGHFLGTYNLHE